MKILSLRKSLIARSTLLLIVVACIPIAWLVRRNMRKAAEANQWVEHTNQVLLQLERLQASTNDMVAIVERRSVHASPSLESQELNQTRMEESEALARLRCLVADNPSQRDRMPVLWQTIVQNSPDLDPSLPPAVSGAVLHAASEEARQQQSALSRIVQSMTSEERHELKREEAALATDESSDNRSILLLLVACGALVAISMLAIERELRARRRSEQATAQAAVQLQQSVRELEDHNEKITILNSLGGSLQICSSEQEVFSTVEKFLRSGCAHLGGAIALITSSRNLTDVAWRWGDIQVGDFYSPVDCCAMRSGQNHLLLPGFGSQLRCRHLSADRSISACLPLSAQGETIGVLHLEFSPAQADAFQLCHERLLPSLCSAMALSLANLRLRETLRNQSIRDPLTGLYNRRYLEEMFDRELRRAERHHSRIALIMLDVDHFKSFNDSYGHEAGDVVLKELGAVLPGIFREEDIVCRFGGEEFAVVLPEVNGGVAIPVAEKLLAEVSRLQPRLNGKPLPPVTISGGLAEYPGDAPTAAQLIRIADERLYQAKHSGRNRVVTPGGTVDGARFPTELL